jgi:hypothetical protein
MNPSNDQGTSEKSIDSYSQFFYRYLPFSVPVIVFLLTYIFVPFCPYTLLWLPLILIYWTTIWTYTILYQKRRGGVFTKERFQSTLKLQGKYLWLQYLLNYGNLIYAIPLFIINYSSDLSLNMYLALFAASIINGPSEEIYWRACLDEAGKNAGLTEKKRLIITPIMFALWHTAFVYHLYPRDATWFVAWLGILIMTWSSGILWHWVMHRSKRVIPQCISHACGNFLSIFPLILITIIKFSF